MAVVRDTLPRKEPMSLGKVQIDEVGPKDKNGDQTFTVSWWTNYTPSKPFPHKRAQIFHTNLEQFLKRHDNNGTEYEVKT
jgi:hypothetical protein